MQDAVGLAGSAAPPARVAQARVLWRALRADRPALGGLVFIVLVAAVSLTIPWYSPYDPTAPVAPERLSPPLTSGHPLGVDGQQRDVLTRLLWGGRLSLLAGLVPTAATTLIALVLGGAAAYLGGAVDAVVMRAMDILFAFPSVLLAVAIAAALGPNERNQMVAIGIVLVPYLTRVAHDSVRSVSALPYVEASRSLGAGGRRILLRHLLPNALPPVLVYSTTLVGLMMVLASGLSFLGLGVQPPTPDWGVMVKDGKDVIEVAPWLSTFPAVMILLTALAFNYLGDGLADALDPRKRGLKIAAANTRGKAAEKRFATS